MLICYVFFVAPTIIHRSVRFTIVTQIGENAVHFDDTISVMDVFGGDDKVSELYWFISTLSTFITHCHAFHRIHFT